MEKNRRSWKKEVGYFEHWSAIPRLAIEMNKKLKIWNNYWVVWRLNWVKECIMHARLPCSTAARRGRIYRTTIWGRREDPTYDNDMHWWWIAPQDIIADSEHKTAKQLRVHMSRNWRMPLRVAAWCACVQFLVTWIFAVPETPLRNHGSSTII